MSPFIHSFSQSKTNLRGASPLCQALCWGLRTDSEPRVPAVKELPGMRLWERGGVDSVTSSSAFYVNLRRTTKTSWFLLSFPLIAPKGQVGTMLTFLRPPPTSWNKACVCGCGVRLVVMTTPPSLRRPPLPSCRTPAIVSCWASASKPKTPTGRDLGPTGWRRVKHLVDVISETSQAPPELCKLFAFGIIAIQAFEPPSTNCPDLV